MKRPLVLLALLASTGAYAQGKANPIGLRLHLGYGTTSSFQEGGDSHSSQGLEFGVAFPVGRLFGQELFLEPSLFAGRLFGGGDDDIDVYRFAAYVRHPLPRGLALRGGVGYAVSNGRGDGESGVTFDFGLEVPFTFKLLKSIDPYMDVHTILSSERQLSGFFVGVGLKV